MNNIILSVSHSKCWVFCVQFICPHGRRKIIQKTTLYFKLILGVAYILLVNSPIKKDTQSKYFMNLRMSYKAKSKKILFYVNYNLNTRNSWNYIF